MAEQLLGWRASLPYRPRLDAAAVADRSYPSTAPRDLPGCLAGRLVRYVERFQGVERPTFPRAPRTVSSHPAAQPGCLVLPAQRSTLRLDDAICTISDNDPSRFWTFDSVKIGRLAAWITPRPVPGDLFGALHRRAVKA